MNFQTLKIAYSVDDPQEDLKTQIKSCIWLKYLSRPKELNDLNLSKYAYILFGMVGMKRIKKIRRIIKLGVKDILFGSQLADCKQREKAIDVIINLSQYLVNF